VTSRTNGGSQLSRHPASDLGSDWTVVATVNDPDGESSGIVDASKWHGPGSWLLDVQAHGSSPHILGYSGSVPAATINACGAEWAEWVDIDLPGPDPDAHCAAFFDDGDQCLVTEELPDVPHPLVLQVFMQSGGGSTTFAVDLPPLDPSWP